MIDEMRMCLQRLQLVGQNPDGDERFEVADIEQQRCQLISDRSTAMRSFKDHEGRLRYLKYVRDVDPAEMECPICKVWEDCGRSGGVAMSGTLCLLAHVGQAGWQILHFGVRPPSVLRRRPHPG